MVAILSSRALFILNGGVVSVLQSVYTSNTRWGWHCTFESHRQQVPPCIQLIIKPLKGSANCFAEIINVSKIYAILTIWLYEFFNAVLDRYRADESRMKLLCPAVFSFIQLHKHTWTWLLTCSYSCGCRQTSLVFRLSNCANTLKGGQSAWLGSLMLVNSLWLIRDKRNLSLDTHKGCNYTLINLQPVMYFVLYIYTYTKRQWKQVAVSLTDCTQRHAWKCRYQYKKANMT